MPSNLIASALPNPESQPVSKINKFKNLGQNKYLADRECLGRILHTSDHYSLVICVVNQLSGKTVVNKLGC
jgi:hypothetical protein